MVHKINEDCVGCGSCVGTCPQEAILSNGDKFKICSEQCTDCSSCLSSCPVEAISKE